MSTSQKMRPRIEQMQFGPELFSYIERLIASIDTIENLENISNNVTELNDIIEEIKKDLSEISDQIADKLGTLDMVPRLYVIEETFSFTNEDNIFINLPSRAIELKTIFFENLTNDDNLKLIISEHNDFSTEDYSSLERRQIYDIANIPIIDQDNEEDFKLKLKFINKYSNTNSINVKFKIKLTNFSMKELN